MNYQAYMIYPIAASQDHTDQHQLQVNLRPNDIPFWDYIGLDMEDLPPSYEEAVKMALSTQVWILSKYLYLDSLK